MENKSWKLTSFYGHPNPAKRHEAWNLLKFLKDLHPCPWLCFGDFNEIANNSEKWGAAIRRDSQMEMFRDTLEFCRLNDLGFIGSKYTWNNGRDSAEFTKEWLDRALGNLEWCELFQEKVVHVLPSNSSNHKPQLIQCDITKSQPIKKTKVFRFEESWTQDEEFHVAVKKAWEEGPTVGRKLKEIKEKLAFCSKVLSKWGREKFGKMHKDLITRTAQLEILQQNEGPHNREEIHRLQGEINEILEMEDVKWRQRAKQNWYKWGDRNTPYFHAWASQRRRTNRMEIFFDLSGCEHVEQEEVCKAFFDFYSNLFTSGGTWGVEECLAGIQPTITDDMNFSL